MLRENANDLLVFIAVAREEVSRKRLHSFASLNRR